MKKNLLLSSVLVSASAAAMGGAASAQDEQPRVREVITVTATKTEQSAQDIPVAVQALDSENLEEFRIDTFSDYLVQLPGVTAGGNGPGQRTIYIRGIASTTPNLTTAGVAGLAPNVAFYLDEQPLAQPGRNLDVYAADIERIEVLSGPQGTLLAVALDRRTLEPLGSPVALFQGIGTNTNGVDMGVSDDGTVEAIHAAEGDSLAVDAVILEFA